MSKDKSIPSMSLEKEVPGKAKAVNKSWKKKMVDLSWKIKLIIGVVLVAGIAGGWWMWSNNQKSEVTYETSQAYKGTLINTISSSGTITSGNYTNVTTKTSGVVSKVYVTNGDSVSKGQKIAEVSLDDYARERQSSAWVAYLAASEESLAAKNDKSQADVDMWKSREEILAAEDALSDMNDNDTNPKTNEVYTVGEREIIKKTVDQTKLAFSVAEAKYKNADARIVDASAKVAAALRDYQENSATIVAPAAGKITDLALAEGIVVSASSATSSTSGATIVSAQTVGKINHPESQMIATVSLTEIDIIKVKANQKVTLTLDAYEDKTFTGKVMAVNTSGSVSSGVTGYPVTILLDPVEVDIYPNMAVSAEIIMSIKNDVLLVPSSAVTTSGEQSTVQIMKNGIVSSVNVGVGSSNDSETEITSGLNEGDEVVTSTVSTATTSSSSNSTTSPFSGVSSTRRFNNGGGGGPPGF